MGLAAWGLGLGLLLTSDVLVDVGIVLRTKILSLTKVRGLRVEGLGFWVLGSKTAGSTGSRLLFKHTGSLLLFLWV